MKAVRRVFPGECRFKRRSQGRRPRGGKWFDGTGRSRMERAIERDKVSFQFKTKIVEELGSWGLHWLQVPSFIKDGTVTRLDNAGVKVKIHDVLVRCGIAKKYSGEIVVIKLTSS
jgi:hypothetical protein